MKYIVIWCLLNWMPEPCPDANKVDEFGRVNRSTSCAVLHGHFERGEIRRKEFSTLDSAQAFYNRANDNQYSLYNRIGCLEFDSAEVK